MEQSVNISGFAAIAAFEPIADQALDDDLVAAVRAGDQASFEILFERHRRAVTRLAYRFFYHREEVEDIVQESFANAYFALGAYRGGQERSFIAWLSRITVRTCYDAIRRTRRAARLITELSDDEKSLLAGTMRDFGSDVERAAISRDLASKLLARLEPDDRLVLTLLNVADLSVL